MGLLRRRAAGALTLAAALATIALAGAPAAAQGAAPAARHVVLAFLPRAIIKPTGQPNPEVLDLFDPIRSLRALGLVSATQGGFNAFQSLLDLTQGTRTSATTYHPQKIQLLRFELAGRHAGVITGWAAADRRATTAPADLFPGLLASSVPGGAAFAGVYGISHLVAIAAARRDGTVPAVSLGRAGTLIDRTQALLQTHRFVVVGLPRGFEGRHLLAQLLARRAPDDLVLALESPPVGAHGPQLLAGALAGPGHGGALTSESTHQEGVVAMIDVAPTVLHALGLRIPAAMIGQPITTEGSRSVRDLHDLRKRLSVIGARRLAALQVFMLTWLLVTLVLGVFRDRAGVLRALRLGGLALFWLPTTLLISAIFITTRQQELAILSLGSFLLALVSDRLVRWPRGLALPSAVGLVLYTVDLARGSPLIVRSLLGPSPRSGSRFYGIGNELEIALTVLLLVGIAAGLRQRRQGAVGAGAFAIGGLALAAIIGAGRLGADVGGVFTVGSGAAVATALMLPWRPRARTWVLVALTPFLGIGLLALIDLASGGNGHFSRSVLHAHHTSDLWHTVKRRYEVAWNILKAAYTPIVSAISLLAVAYAARYRARIYAAVGDDPAWRAALIGGVVSSVVGSLANDSGPVLLLIGIVALASATAYLRGGADPAAEVRA